MSNLLLLADVASKDTLEKAKSTADASVQTDFIVDFQNASNNRPPFFQQFPATVHSHDHGGNIFDLPHLPPLHDYVKQTDFDYLVNYTHDYYNRTAPPERELEHSYAFFDGDGTSDASTSGNVNNGILDDGCFEAIANLDEYMGLTSETLPVSSLLCEEVVDEIDVQNVVHLDDLDVDDLIEFICPSDQAVADGENEQAQQEEMSNCHVDFECALNAVESSVENCGILLSTDAATSSSTAQFIDQQQPTMLQCQWENCGCLVAILQSDSFENHLLKDHIRRKPRLSKILGDHQWICLWNGCDRKEPFSHRYQLLRHLRCHTMEAPFTCSECNSSFKSKELMKVHERRAHKAGNPYVCHVCQKPFASTGDLSRHRRTHQPMKVPSFVCMECNLLYKDESGLRKHRQRCHELDSSSKQGSQNRQNINGTRDS